MNNIHMKYVSNKKKTQEQYINEVAQINSYVEVLGVYINSKTPIEHRCKKCGRIWNTNPSTILNGGGCKSCSAKEANAKRRKSTAEFLEEIKDVKNSSIEVIGEYKGTHIKIECHCNICGENYFIRPSDLKRGYGHSKCSHIKQGKESRKDNKYFLDRMKDINNNIIFLSEYISTNVKVKCKCSICQYEWEAYPENLYKGAGCPKCADIRGGQKRKEKTLKKYINFLKPLDIQVVENYIDCYTPILHKCMKCGCEWKIDQHHATTRGISCPSCYGSKGEQKISLWLKTNNIKSISQVSFNDLKGVNNGLLSYDFYLPYHNILIEYQGIQHEQPIEYFGGIKQFEIQLEHDKRKREYALYNNYNYLEIWYYDYDNIETILEKYLNQISVETVIPA